jgi:adenine-specific DNA methylase
MFVCIYIYIYVCVCVCVCQDEDKPRVYCTECDIWHSGRKYNHDRTHRRKVDWNCPECGQTIPAGKTGNAVDSHKYKCKHKKAKVDRLSVTVLTKPGKYNF